MTVDVEISRKASSAGESKLFVGRFVRRQGQFGTVAVVGHLRTDGVEVIPDPKRLFPREGQVETQGRDHAGLNPGDWAEFDIVRNTRPRAPGYKVTHLKRLPRYAVLPEATLPEHRMLLTNEGWRGDARPGLWAFRLSGDMVIVVEMDAGKDGRLRISRAASGEVKCYRNNDRVVRLGRSGASDDVFVVRDGDPMTSFDWSNEVDYISSVVRSLAGVNDPRFSDIIAWLDLHQEKGTGRAFGASGSKEPAMEALRSGALASRLRADRELMEVYLAAALHDDAVREAVTAYAKEGHGTEREKLRKELAQEIAIEKAGCLEELSAEMSERRAAGVARLEQQLAQHEEAGRAAQAARLEQADREFALRIETLESGLSERKEALEHNLAEQTEAFTRTKAMVATANAELENLRGDAEEARARLSEAQKEIDRLLAMAPRLSPADQMASAPVSAPRGWGFARVFPNHPRVGVAAKGRLILSQAMLSEKGKELLQRLLVMLLSGEVPILVGDHAADLLRVAEAIICPGRFVSIEADPTLISLDDLWSRPGSGMPTLLALAADAAKDGGAVLVSIRGIERSGARFWMPALMEALRSGGLPRGLFVCCLVKDREHDEVVALPNDVSWLHISDIFMPGASSAGPSLLTHPHIDLETLDPGPMPTDLSAATAVVLQLGDQLSLAMAMRAARIFAEAELMLGDEEAAQRIVLSIAKPLVSKS